MRKSDWGNPAVGALFQIVLDTLTPDGKMVDDMNPATETNKSIEPDWTSTL